MAAKAAVVVEPLPSCSTPQGDGHPIWYISARRTERLHRRSRRVEYDRRLVRHRIVMLHLRVAYEVEGGAVKSLVGEVLRAVNRSPIPYTASNGIRSLLSGISGSKTAQLGMMGANGTLFAIVNRTSTSVASVDWHMHRKVKGAICDLCECPGVQLVEVHPALTVFNKPNDYYTRQELVESGQQHTDLVGECWLVIARLGTVPYELWPVRPDRLEVITDKKDFLGGYVYRGPSGEEIPLKPQDVISMRMPNPLDPYRGMGPVQTVMYNLESSRAASEYNRNFFHNNAEPGGIIKFSKRLHDHEFRQIVDRWREQHQGVSNSHRVAVFEEGMDWIDRKFTQRDMQFVELLNLDQTLIMRAFGIPEFALGIVDNVNRANAEASKAWFAESMTVPRLDRWKGMLNNDFLPQFPGYDPGLSFVYTSPVPADREADDAERTSKASAAASLVAAGWDPDDVLETVGLPPMRYREKAPEKVVTPSEQASN